MVKTNRTGKIRQVILRAVGPFFLLIFPPISKVGWLHLILKLITLLLIAPFPGMTYPENPNFSAEVSPL
jgi:hypothetical protein